MFLRTFKHLTYLGVCLLLCARATGLCAQEDKGKKTIGKTEKRTYEFKEAGKAMEYALYVPSGYDKDKKTPLMIALHGLGGNPQQMIRSRGLTEQAEKYGYIVAAPMGYNSSGWYGAPTGGFGKKGFGGKKGEKVPENLGELSEKDVMNVLAECRKEFNVDEKRIYLIGHSMGGAGTWHIGTKYSEIWAGLAPIAPAAFGAPKNLNKLDHIPVILLCGDKDSLVSGSRRWWAALKEQKMPHHDYVEVKGADHGSVIGQGMPTLFEFFEKHKK
jgi:poly(3-hydroxybutyrate) depolymerase